MDRYFVEMTCGPIWIYADGWFCEDGFVRFYNTYDIVADLPRVFVKKVSRKNYDELDYEQVVM